MGASPSLFTSTRQITGITIAPDGTVWAGTTGGILRIDPSGSLRKFTREDGLPADEVRAISLAAGRPVARFPVAEAVWNGEGWKLASRRRTVEPASEGPLTSCVWQGDRWEATGTGLRYRRQGIWREVSQPPSAGTHVSALLPRGGELWAALYGDGLWAFSGTSWRASPNQPPAAAREITALAECGRSLWIGTRREGLWQLERGRWRQWLVPDEPYAHDIQSAAVYRGEAYFGTLEDGLVAATATGWRHFAAGEISSDAPRQMAVFQDRLYLRNGDGRLDRFDGSCWARDVAASLPRRQVTALATDGARLYAAQWGGWSEFDGRAWTHRLNLPELQGIQVTCLLPDGGTIWVGTQGRGLAEVRRSDGRVRWHGDAAGLPDDWITALSRQGDAVCAGTFVGGLAIYRHGHWSQAKELRGQNVTDLTMAGGKLVIATRTGVWTRTAGAPLARLPGGYDREAQALAASPVVLWVGSRTSISARPVR